MRKKYHLLYTSVRKKSIWIGNLVLINKATLFDKRGQYSDSWVGNCLTRDSVMHYTNLNFEEGPQALDEVGGCRSKVEMAEEMVVRRGHKVPVCNPHEKLSVAALPSDVGPHTSIKVIFCLPCHNQFCSLEVECNDLLMDGQHINISITVLDTIFIVQTTTNSVAWIPAYSIIQIFKKSHKSNA